MRKKEVVSCKYCGEKEYLQDMRWINGNNTVFKKCIICDELVNSDMHYHCSVCEGKIDWD